MPGWLLLWAILSASCVPRARPTPDDRLIGAACEVIAYGGVASAKAAGVRLARTEGGAVLAWLPRPERRSAAVDDLLIEADLRGKLATDGLLAGSELDVDVDRGRVRLAGPVRASDHAGRALRLALDTRGSRVVESRLTWPVPASIAAIRRRFEVLSRSLQSGAP